MTAVAPALAEALAAAEAGELSGEERIVVAAARRDYDRAVKLPADLVADGAGPTAVLATTSTSPDFHGNLGDSGRNIECSI